MVVSIHQPNFIPWLGYFYKILKSDLFVFLDDVQFSKNSFINRNKIKSPAGAQWVTLPVYHTGYFGAKINEVHIMNKKNAVNKILKTLKVNYSRTSYFHMYIKDIEDVLMKDTEMICDLNISLIILLLKLLASPTKVIHASSLNIQSCTATKRLVAICKKIHATEYLCGFGSIKYQDNVLFQEAGIRLKVTDFIHPIYQQQWGTFIPNLSILDLLFNCGQESKHILIERFSNKK